jgi:hypothetical protein
MSGVTMRRLTLAILIVALVSVTGSVLAAQFLRPASVSRPILGYVADAAGALRPLMGVLGSASVEGALDLGFDVVEAAIPPHPDYILATTPGSNLPVLLQFRNGAWAGRSLDSYFGDCSQVLTAIAPWDWKPIGCVSSPIQPSLKIDKVELSPTGSAAALYSQSTGKIVSLTDLSSAPAVAGQFAVGTLGAIDVFAISDDGHTLALAVSDGGTSALFVMTLRALPRRIGSSKHLSDIQFLRNSSAAIASDDVDEKVYWVSNGQMVPIAGAEQDIASPAAISLSDDNQKIFVASMQTNSISTIGLGGVVSEPILCHCILTGLHHLNADSVYRLNDFSGGSIVLLDGASTPPRILLVPVAQR